jgi:hypothetical protein
MSIRNAEEGRERQEKQRAARREKEAHARPDVMHRAVIFLLKECMQNNPDVADEIRHHITALDEELADPDRVNELEPARPADKQIPETDQSPSGTTSATDTADAVRTSKRFRRPKT